MKIKYPAAERGSATSPWVIKTKDRARYGGNMSGRIEGYGNALELYLHIPFCVKKCQYCDFLSAPAPAHVVQAYLDQMTREIQAVSRQYTTYQVVTIFLGGGTPSILLPAQMQRLLEQIYKSFCVVPDAEITVECNPGTLDAAKLRAYRESGVNRLSIGLQSADEYELRVLGRVHTFREFVSNYELARSMGYQNINVDLMAALPGQTADTYAGTLRKVIALAPEHISVYSLMIEEGTPFFERYGEAARLRAQGKKQSRLPGEEEERTMDDLTKEMLFHAGYLRYEISNYARDGFACRHNIGYWRRKNYLGIGLGASSMIENLRFSNTLELDQYLHADFTKSPDIATDRKRLKIYEQMEEFMFLGLRMTQGISSAEFQRQFQKNLEEVYGTILEEQLRKHFIKRTEEGFCLTDFGMDISNYVMAEYLFDH